MVVRIKLTIPIFDVSFVAVHFTVRFCQNVLNGSFHTDTDSFHSYEGEDSSPVKSVLSPGESESPAYEDSPNTSGSGTPRVIRRVGPISAVYAPDKDARTAMLERMNSPPPPPARLPGEREIIVGSTPESGRSSAMGTTFSTEFFTPKPPSTTEDNDISDRDMSSDLEGHTSPGRTASTGQETLLAELKDADEQSVRPSTPISHESSMNNLSSPEANHNISDLEKNTTASLSPVNGTAQPDSHGDTSDLPTSPAIQPVPASTVASGLPIQKQAGIEQNNHHHESDLLPVSNDRLSTMDEVPKAEPDSSQIVDPVTSHRAQSAFRSVAPRAEIPESVTSPTLSSDDKPITQPVASSTGSPNDTVVTTPINPHHSLQAYSTVPLLSMVDPIEEDESDVHHESFAIQSTATKQPNHETTNHFNVNSTDPSSQTVEQIQVLPTRHTGALPPDLVSLGQQETTEPSSELQSVVNHPIGSKLTPVTSSASESVTQNNLIPQRPTQVGVAPTDEISSGIVTNTETFFPNDGDNEKSKQEADAEATIVSNTSFTQLPDGDGPTSSHRRMSASEEEPISPIAIDLQVKVDAKLDPSTPEEVDKSSKLVFGNFIAERYKLEVNASATASVHGTTVSLANASASVNISVPSTSQTTTEADHRLVEDDVFGTDLASIPRSGPDRINELSQAINVCDLDFSMEMAVARNLAQIGDEINRRYGPRLDRMIKLLPVNECPMGLFSRVALALFNRGPTNWGQIVTLFYFGYRLVIRRVRSDVANAFLQVYNCLINFCRQCNIFRWIAQQGGWVSHASGEAIA
ncbi:unnamed protein product [Echinostoma caproni]|uniref:BCL domain-containing protein n=1 Tax=Echinostoma caproni TaxID=27848 RepID=A0A183AHR8_9TREM|nr:unnamed protein product [Echinostoma caproni]